MARQLTIIGLGEAILLEHPDGNRATGLAPTVALDAVRMGHVGVAISRVGQDRAAGDLLERLKGAGVDVSHVQSDPDLPTGREVVRPLSASVRRYLEERTAFDNLQWDFDLQDAAQEADAVIYSLLTRRSGQTRSEENRFLAECTAALKVFDLTNRGPDEIDRGHAATGLALADGAVIDQAALRAVFPGSDGLPLRSAALSVLRDERLSFLVTVEDLGEEGQRITLHTPDEAPSAAIPGGRAPLVAAIVALLHGVLRGRAPSAAVEVASGVAAFAAAHPDAPFPPEHLGDPPSSNV